MLICLQHAKSHAALTTVSAAADVAAHKVQTLGGFCCWSIFSQASNLSSELPTAWPSHIQKTCLGDVWLAVDFFLFNTWETTFQGAFSCPLVSDRCSREGGQPPPTTRHTLAHHHSCVSHSLSVFWFIKTNLSVGLAKARWISVSTMHTAKPLYILIHHNISPATASSCPTPLSKRSHAH